ncbi:SAP DNA-binding domain-containing protein [Tieghemostelium lacteum]|uniref:SAP DNA-binding domain-containing protein n=1 Tax=Tieghemostelium lacteum TaxID=361077 RepID=A0A151Z351_TIELA|nr:SAP DNA-binding domain-containing protein [Tieghemostelium lacteum]|eukprot:KYQ88375.1 SAP DNA-binding domain-containing protein [Tieghemostelium lacteum]
MVGTDRKLVSEEVLYKSLSKLSLNRLTDCLSELGYTETPDQKQQALKRLVLDARELGIEDLIERLKIPLISEIGSLLELSSSNSTNETEQKSQLEEHIKKQESLEGFFYSLTPYLLNQICKSLQIKTPNLPNNSSFNTPSTPSKSTTPQIADSNNIHNTKHMVHVDEVGNAVITRLSTKSLYTRYEDPKNLYGDGAVEGQLCDTIIENLRKEILLSGVENLLSVQNQNILFQIYKELEIPMNQPNKLSDIVTNITKFLFNIIPSSSSSSSSSSSKTQHSIPSSPIPNQAKKPYPQTPSNISSSEDETTTIYSQDEDDDSEIDKPAIRPSISDIKEGITKEQLGNFLLKDLKSWLKSKNLKYNDKKPVLENRILIYLKDNAATSCSEEDDTKGRKRSISHKDKMKAKKLKESRCDDDDEIQQQ